MSEYLTVCAHCEKKLTPDMELEFSDWYSEVFCCPDCARDFYFENAGSLPITWEDLQKKRKKK